MRRRGVAATIALGACALVFVLRAPVPALADDLTQKELLERLKKLEENQAKLYELLKAKDARLDTLETELKQTKQAAQPAAAPAEVAPPDAKAAALAESSETVDSSPAPPEPGAPVKEKAPPAITSPAALKGVLGTYEQGRGFGLARNEFGEVNFGIYTYVRYLNQTTLNNTYKNGLGQETRLDHRNDVELNKVKIEFRGWLIDPHFRYVLYSWTNNAAQGQGAQVVLGGNLNWAFGPWLTIGGGILSLPTTRTTQGTFPYWLTVDHRTASDEFFRGSYTMGFYGYGTSHGFGYFGMLANNLSILGVDAAQLDGDFSTVSVAAWWMPTTGEYGPKQGYGDYEEHERVATRIGGHFTFSPEDRQSQPNADDIDNSQIRLSNGTIIFTPGAVTPGVGIEKVKYYMADVDAGAKWKGFELSGEYYLRWLNDFVANGPLTNHQTFDHGFQLMASQMVLPQTVQVYTMGSYIFGEYGDSWEMTGGMNWWIFRRRELRLNLEYIYDHQSPIGGTAYPQLVGGTGSIFNANVEMSF